MIHAPANGRWRGVERAGPGWRVNSPLRVENRVNPPLLGDESDDLHLRRGGSAELRSQVRMSVTCERDRAIQNAHHEAHHLRGLAESGRAITTAGTGVPGRQCRDYC